MPTYISLYKYTQKGTRASKMVLHGSMLPSKPCRGWRKTARLLPDDGSVRHRGDR